MKVTSLASLLPLFLFAGCGSCRDTASPAPAAETARPTDGRRLIVLGFDGADPRWVERWVNEGKLPNIQKLMNAAEGRGLRRLASTNPPQSPVAWTTFATGTNPGDHGIFDFLAKTIVREGPLAVRPAVATTSFEIQASGPPVARNLRTGIPFWKTLADDGVRVVAINVPYSFPPDPMRAGRMLSGLGTPDLRGTNSTFTYAGTEVQGLARPDGTTRPVPVAGGVLVPIRLEGAIGHFDLDGPAIVEAKPGTCPEEPCTTRRTLSIPVEVRAIDGALGIKIGTREVRVEKEQTSPWIELEFASESGAVRGLVQATVLEIQPQIRLFLTPIGIHPRAQWTPIAYPQAFAETLADDLGDFYKTVGWDHDTSALTEEVIDDGVFLAQVDALEAQRQEMLLDRMTGDDWDMLLWVSTATDRVAHMFYRLIDPEHPRYDASLAARYGDAIEKQYVRMDQTIGKVLEKLGPHDTLLVISDHGFHNYRRGLHVNSWLVSQGLMALKQGAAGGRELYLDVDWAETKAYALGTGQIFLNLRGRERFGSINAGDGQQVLQQIRAGLLALRDEEKGGVSPIAAVYLGSEIFTGGRHDDAPDLQVAFHENYRTSWETMLGGAPAGLFADNTKKWSGDHAASDARETPGILLSNRPIPSENPAIVDLAPTAVAFFGRPRPERYVGRDILSD